MMTGVKVWVISGIVYLALVIAGYSLITGANPLTSGELHHPNHGNGDVHEDDEHNGTDEHDNGLNDHTVEHGDDHLTSEDKADHGDHPHIGGESEVITKVTYKGGKLQVRVEDQDGNVPELRETHERLMHLIVVSYDLEKYYHYHPVEVTEGVFETDVDLEDGHFYVFVDIVPKEKKYITYPIGFTVGEHSHDSMDTATLTPDDNLIKSVDGKEVELKYSYLVAGEHVTLTFDLKGKSPLPYLGALGHVVIIDGSVEKFIHVHPVSHNETVFDAYFPVPGVYKLWAEFKFEEVGVLVFPFVIEVPEQ